MTKKIQKGIHAKDAQSYAVAMALSSFEARGILSHEQRLELVKTIDDVYIALISGKIVSLNDDGKPAYAARDMDTEPTSDVPTTKRLVIGD